MRLYNTGRVEQGRKGAYNSKLFHNMNKRMRDTEEKARELKSTIFAMNQFMFNYKRKMKENFRGVMEHEETRF